MYFAEFWVLGKNDLKYRFMEHSPSLIYVSEILFTKAKLVKTMFENQKSVLMINTFIFIINDFLLTKKSL